MILHQSVIALDAEDVATMKVAVKAMSVLVSTTGGALTLSMSPADAEQFAHSILWAVHAEAALDPEEAPWRMVRRRPPIGGRPVRRPWRS